MLEHGNREPRVAWVIAGTSSRRRHGAGDRLIWLPDVGQGDDTVLVVCEPAAEGSRRAVRSRPQP